jgi:hypothetical protein
MARTTTTAAVRAAADAIVAGLPATAEAIGAELRAAAPELAADEDILRETIASIRANITVGLSVITGETPRSQIRAPGEALALSRAFVHRSVPLDRLLQTYLAGRTVMWRIWLDELVPRIRDGRQLAPALRLSSDRIDAYLEVVVSALVREYEHERERWVHSRQARTAEAVRTLLHSKHDSAPDLAHDFGLHQTALIIWSSGPQTPELPDRLADCLSMLLAQARIGRALSVPVGTSSLWAWIASASPIGADRIAVAAGELPNLDEVLIACGRPLAGVDGFRESHRQALRTEHVVRRMAAPGRVTSHEDVGVLALLGDDEDEARELVARELGGLTGSDPASARLRSTLRTYLACDRNASRAARRLSTHRNTILYRIQAAEQRLGRDLAERRLELELALILADTLGERVLSRISEPGGSPAASRPAADRR